VINSSLITKFQLKNSSKSQLSVKKRVYLKRAEARTTATPTAKPKCSNWNNARKSQIK